MTDFRTPSFTSSSNVVVSKTTQLVPGTSLPSTTNTMKTALYMYNVKQNETQTINTYFSSTLNISKSTLTKLLETRTVINSPLLDFSKNTSCKFSSEMTRTTLSTLRSNIISTAAYKQIDSTKYASKPNSSISTMRFITLLDTSKNMSYKFSSEITKTSLSILRSKIISTVAYKQIDSTKYVSKPNSSTSRTTLRLNIISTAAYKQIDSTKYASKLNNSIYTAKGFVHNITTIKIHQSSHLSDYQRFSRSQAIRMEIITSAAISEIPNNLVSSSLPRKTIKNVAGSSSSINKNAIKDKGSTKSIDGFKYKPKGGKTVYSSDNYHLIYIVAGFPGLILLVAGFIGTWKMLKQHRYVQVFSRHISFSFYVPESQLWKSPQRLL